MLSALWTCAAAAALTGAPAARAQQESKDLAGEARRSLADIAGRQREWETLLDRALPEQDREVETWRGRYLDRRSARERALHARDALRQGALRSCQSEECRERFEDLLVDCPGDGRVVHGLLIPAYYQCRAVAAGSIEPCVHLSDRASCLRVWEDSRLARAVIERRPEALGLCMADVGGTDKNGKPMTPAQAKGLCELLLEPSTTIDEYCRRSHEFEPEEPYEEFLKEDCLPGFLVIRGEPQACSRLDEKALAGRQFCAEIVAFRKARDSGDAGFCGGLGLCRAMALGDPKGCEAYTDALRASCPEAPASSATAPSRLLADPGMVTSLERGLEERLRKAYFLRGEARLMGHEIEAGLERVGGLVSDLARRGAKGELAALSRELDKARESHRRAARRATQGD